MDLQYYESSKLYHVVYMRNGVWLIFLFLISCGTRNQSDKVFDNVEIISISNAVKDDLSILDSIEIIPLDNSDMAMMKGFSSYQYLRNEGMHLVIDDRQYIYIFDENGRLISSSIHQNGDGPQQYLMAIDVLYNPYSHLIEIYSPVKGGIIHCYDLSFNWKRNIQLPKNEEYSIFSKIELLSSDVYALEPGRTSEENLSISLYDFSNSVAKTDNIGLVDEGYVSTLTMMQKAFMKCGDTIYYTPHYLDYHYYRYDFEDKRFVPIYGLDLGEMITKRELDSKVDGKRKNETVEEMFWRKCEYLLSSKYMLPIIRIMNKSFVYACCISERNTYHVIYNRSTRKTYFLSPDAKVKLHRCYALQDNVLSTIIFPYQLDSYVNKESKKYISDATRQRLLSIQDEDNPVIIKYYLSK